MFGYLIDSESFERVHHQQLLDQVDGRGRYLVPVLRREAILSSFYQLESVRYALAVKRRVAAQQNIQNYAYTPHIARLAISCLFQHLRRNIDGAAADRFQLALPLFYPRKAKVGNHQRGLLALVFVQKIFRLQIPVHDVSVMQVLYPLDDVHHHLGCVILAVLRPRHNALKQLPAGCVVHHHVEALRLVVDLVQADDVGVVDLAQYVYFPPNIV
mmetsp:Transcript_11097/g.29127  ORF Transcript_11097/g.29127 Transcript_11097/m.29127 type:complete len:214 (-) Transcript_11097:1991-2632(-)